MAILSYTAPTGLQAAYSRQGFTVTGLLSYPTDPPKYPPVLRAAIYINGAFYANLRFSELASFVQAGTDWTYVFDVNVSEAMQEYFENTDTLPDYCSSDILVNPPVAYTIIFTEFYESGGIMVENPLTANTLPVRAINASLPTYHNQDLSRFDPALGASDFLTNKPETARRVCRQECESISVLDFSGAFSYIAYDANGLQIGLGTYSQALTNGTATFPTGAENASNFAWTTQAGALPNDPATAYYDIGIAGASSLVRYYVSSGCCTSYRVVFLNMYGAYDYYSIEQYKEESFIVKSNDFERISKTNGLSGRGLNRVQAYGQDVFTVEQIRVSKKEMTWLKELLNSPDVYLEGVLIPPECVETGRLAVVVKDATFKTIQSEPDFLEFSCTFVAANRWFSQRN